MKRATTAIAAVLGAVATALGSDLAALEMGAIRPGGTVEFEMAMPGPAGDRLVLRVLLEGAPAVVELDARSHRATGFRVLLDDGGAIREVEAPPAATYRGRVVDRPGRRVAASISGGRLRGTILGSDDPRPAGAGDGLHRAEIAFDADFEFFSLNGQSVPATVADIESIMNVVTMVYEDEVDITYEVTAILVRSFEPDPYTGNDAVALFQQFRNQWNTQHGDVARDVAHLMTGRTLAGGILGIAGQGVICDLPNAYSMSRSRFFDEETPRVIMTAHLLGHNWNATDCRDDPDCSIMCGPAGGCPGEPLTFGEAATAQIVAHRDSRDCLDAGGACLGDVDASGVVDFDDLLMILAAWGPCDGCAEDLDDDGDVDFDDLLHVLADWGEC